MKKVIATCISAIGVISGVSGILSAPDNIRTYIVFASIAAVSIICLVYLLFLIQNSRRQSIGVDISVLDASFNIVPANDSDLRWIAELQKSVYSKADAVPFRVLKEWFHVFSNGFFVIVDKDNNRVGHIDILPIKESTLALYKLGELTETEIRGESLYSSAEKDKIEDIYIESLIISPKYTSIRPFALRDLMRSLPEIVSRIGNRATIKRVSAMAATRDGERILKRLGFRLISDTHERRDGHRMFEASFKDFYNRVTKPLLNKNSSLSDINVSSGL